MPATKKLPSPRVEVFEGNDGRFYSRLVKRGGKISATGSGGRSGGYAQRSSARRQARIDFPGVAIISV